MGQFSETLLGRGNKPLMLEHSLHPALCEQLIWRRGPHLWQTEETAQLTLADGYRLSGFGGAVVSLSDEQAKEDFPLPDWLRKQLPAETELICGMAEGPAQRIAAGEKPDQILEQFPHAAAALASRSDGLFLRDDWSGISDTGLQQEILSCLKRACEQIHEQGKPVIWVDGTPEPLPLSQLPDCFDAVQLSENYPLSTGEMMREYGKQFCLMGRTDFSRLMTLRPMEIIEDFASLQELAEKGGVRGYIHGSGNISAVPVPYLTYLSMLSAMKRLRYNELDIPIKI